MASPAFATFHEWEVCECEEWNCDCLSGTDPQGKYGLGRDSNNRSIWPSLTFSDFWMMMPEQHRATFKNWKRPRFQYLERLEDRKIRISAVMSELDGRTGHIILCALQQAHEGQFDNRFTLFTMGFKFYLPREPENLEFWVPISEEPSKGGITSYYKSGRYLDASIVELERHQYHHKIKPALLDFPVYGQTVGNKRFRWVAYDYPDSELSDHVRRLPQELRDQIYRKLLDGTVGRREALLEHQSLYPHIFLALSWADYQQYQQTWLTKALWVLSPRTFRVLLDRHCDKVSPMIHQNLQYGVRQLIVRFDHSFLCRTCIEELEAYFDPEAYPMWKDDSRLVPKDMFDVTEEYNLKMIFAQENVLRAWRTALESATYFDLQRLTLDFTDTYGLDGCWMGLQVIRMTHNWHSTSFHTEQLIIKAPDQSKKELIRRELGYGPL